MARLSPAIKEAWRAVIDSQRAFDELLDLGTGDFAALLQRTKDAAAAADLALNRLTDQELGRLVRVRLRRRARGLP